MQYYTNDIFDKHSRIVDKVAKKKKKINFKM